MKPKKVATPGFYKLNSGKSTPSRKKMGRPAAKNKRKKRDKIKHRAEYTRADMTEAVRLVNEEN